MLRKVTAMLIGVLVVTAVVTGCGDSDDETASLTKAEFVQQADAICDQRNKEKQKDLEVAFRNPEKFGITGKGVKAQEELIAKVALPPIAKMVEELAELEAPSGDEEQVEAMVKAYEEEVNRIETDPRNVVTGNGGEFTEANRLGRGYNLKVCSTT